MRRAPIDLLSDGEPHGQYSRLTSRTTSDTKPTQRHRCPASAVNSSDASGGITGVHERLFMETPSAVHVTTTESFAGEPVEAETPGTQTLLDTSLIA
jgi:hypothetical protein